VHFTKWANVYTAIHRTAFIMRASRVAARKSADRYGPPNRASAQRALAWLKREREQVDPAQGKLTLAELCDRYAATIQHQKSKTIERKELIVRRIKQHWPTSRLSQVTKVKPSHVDLWISHYRFGPHSRNLHMACIKEFGEKNLPVTKSKSRSPGRVGSPWLI
jgi:hypothetical protein